MIPISAAMKAFLAQGSQTLCSILRIELTNGTVLGFTDCSNDVTYDDGDGSVTYQAALGYTRKDSAQADDLSADNSEYDGILNSPSITEADLAAGLWDHASLRYSLINYVDTTMGVIRLPGWRLGVVTLNRNQFTAEIRGVMQAYSRTIGELTSAGCRANLGDARCKVGLGPFTVTGTLTGVSADQLTLFDTGRTEPGPSGGVVIANITNSNPCHIQLATGGGASFSNGEAVTLFGIIGPALLNANTFVTNLVVDQFDLTIDTTNTAIYPAYTANSGTCVPLGGGSGYFDFGVITMTSGASNGLSADVLAYVPGQWQLFLPFGFGVAISDTYSMVAGCDKSLNTCLNRFANVANMRAEPYLPGIDQIVQVQKSG